MINPNDSKEQSKQKQANQANNRSSVRSGSVDKRLNGPNRPAE